MSKNILIAFDGTWNTPDDNKTDGNEETNVWRFFYAVDGKYNDEDQTKTSHETIGKYIKGVGTDGNWWNKFVGGAFGVGLSANIQEGYKYLINNYEDGDKIFIIGFSRGAYSARSLVGLIRNSGLLKKDHIDMIREAYSLYRTRDDGCDSENAVWFRTKFSREVNIHFLGVWDTVGELGVPLKSFEWFNKQRYQFHDTELSGIVRHAYHAIAIDEHREDYTVSLWDPKTKPNQTIEQVWFTGAHSDVGGGYDNILAQPSLYWLMTKADGLGLKFTHNVPSSTINTSTCPVTDSYSDFLKGFYKRTKDRYYRNIGSTIFGEEQIHESVEHRLKSDADYKPKNKVFDNLKGTFKPQNKLRIWP